MKLSQSPLFSTALLAGMVILASPLRGATVLNQIGDLSAYTFDGVPLPVPSQIYSDFSDYDCTVMEDFTVTAMSSRIAEVSVLFLAQTGFESFDRVEGYYLNIYSSPAEAAKQLIGDVLSRFLPPTASIVTKVTDPHTGNDYGVVRLAVGLDLPAAGTYWIGVAPKASISTGGDFRVAAANTTGTTNTGGADNANLANPAQGYGGETLTPLDANFAYAVVAVPEPGTWSLLFLASAAILIRKRARAR
ncbi:MAG: PEP-CTERM sorting domain-containing protein [Akkermansiaceae bacterium]|nr:PEP-CTERM sorting domain-containing protein [Akkermansiaceae bacterium]MCF7732015.1 PEP-CTERM sorting domain-containing protein [Akkermansiaceae bacterium]